jgi:CubicO group peptidase (beta-lactamase class C family)
VRVNSQFEAVMDGFIDPAGPGAAVGVRHRNRAPYLAGFGLADIEWGLAMTPDAVFRLGSVTKQFTAAAIMLLVEDGKLGLDDAVQSVLTDYPAQGGVVTIRQLLNHTSGIANFNSQPTFPERTDLTLAEVVGLFKELPPDFEPGERYVYSNSGYVLLGAVIEALSGMAYRTFLLERFFRPLGMRQTRYLYDEPIVPKRARGYSLGPKGVENARTISMTLPHAAGALGSTVGDLLTWDQALRSGRAVSARSYAAMIAPARLNDGSLNEYGFGLIGLTFRDRPTITHLGGINGFATMMAHFPEDDLTVVVLANLDSFPVERALLALTRRALELPNHSARPRISVAVADLARCAGVYQLDGNPWPVTIAAADDGLTTPFPVPQSRFEPFAQAEFQCVDDPELTLRFDQAGKAGYEQLTVEGAMRWRWRTAIGRRTEPPL